METVTASVRSGGRWWELATLRTLLGSEASGSIALGHAFGPDERDPEYAFLAVDTTAAHKSAGAPVRRSLVFLRAGILVRFGIGAGPDAAEPGLSRAEHTRTPNLPMDVLMTQRQETRSLRSLDLEGVTVAGWAILFHNEVRSAQSAVWFETTGQQRLKYLVTGLAPGQWQIWCDGWLEDIGVFVSPQAGTLCFEGSPGSYFLRRLG